MARNPIVKLGCKKGQKFIAVRNRLKGEPFKDKN